MGSDKNMDVCVLNSQQFTHRNCLSEKNREEEETIAVCSDCNKVWPGGKGKEGWIEHSRHPTTLRRFTKPLHSKRSEVEAY